MNKISVTKANALIDARYKLNTNAQKLVLTCIAKLNPREIPPKEIKLSASEYSERMGIDIKNAHRELYKAADALFKSSITILEGDEEIEISWVQEKAKKIKGSGEVRLVWSDKVRKYISELQSRFTTYELKNIAKLQSAHAIRLYELLQRFNDTGERYISLDDFKSSLGIGDKYPEFKTLKRDVITPAVKQISTHSDIEVFFDTVKRGRVVSALHFTFEQKVQMNMPLD